MSYSSTRRRSAPRRAVIAAMLLISAAAHAVLVRSVEVKVPFVPGMLGLRDAAQKEQTEELSFSCVADAALAATAKLGFCSTPFSTGVDQCVSSALLSFDLDKTKCHAVDVAFLDEDALKKLAPKPLMDDVEPTDDIVAAKLLDEQTAKKLEEAEKKISKPDPSGQVVEITRPQVEVPPDKARYLSEYDSRVEKETVARGSTEKMVARPQPRQLPPSKEAPKPPEELKAPPTSKPSESAPARPMDRQAAEQPKSSSVMAMRGPGTGQELPRVGKRDPGLLDGLEKTAPDGTAPPKGQGEFRSSREPVLEPHGGASREPGGGGSPGSTPNLRPSEELLTRAVGGGSVDDLKGIERGDTTALNAKKWKYALFFNRLKRQVAQNWHPDKVYLRRDPTGKVYGTKDRITILRISLTPSGELANVYVLKQCGVDFLDDEAIRAFRQAQPFPNPPTGLVDRSSNLITFSFGFHFQIGERSGWKINWWR